jgi:hypothetical protein
VVPGKQPLTQCQQNKGWSLKDENSRGCTSLSTSTGPQWRRWKWTTHTGSVLKKAQQSLFNLRRLNKFGLSPKTLTYFYRCTIESFLSGCITAWFGTASGAVGSPEGGAVCPTNYPGANYPPSRTPTEPHVTGRPKRSSRTSTTRTIAWSHLCHPEGQYKCIKAGTERLKNNFCLMAIRLLNSHH